MINILWPLCCTDRCNTKGNYPGWDQPSNQICILPGSHYCQKVLLNLRDSWGQDRRYSLRCGMKK